MQYLKLKRSRLILLTFLSSSALLVAFPGIDIAISRLFFDGESFPQNQWWQQALHDGLNYFLCFSLAIVAAIYAYNRLARQHLGGVTGRKLLFLVLALIVGGGLIVNAGLKNHFGRARPRDVIEFNGPKTFTPAFVFSRECRTNCSFSSGDAAGGFFSISLAMAFSRRRRWWVVALAAGTIPSIGRIASGAHFFSDTVVSFFVMLFVSDVLHHYLVLNHESRYEGFGGDTPTPAYASMRSDN